MDPYLGEHRPGIINIWGNHRRMSDNLVQALTEPYNIWLPISRGEGHITVMARRDGSTHPMYLPPERWGLQYHGAPRPVTRATMGFYVYCMRMMTRFRVWARRAVNRLVQRQHRQALVLTRRYRPGITLLGKRPR